MKFFMSFRDLFGIPTVYAPDEKMAEQLNLTNESCLLLGDPCVHCANEEKSALTVILPAKEITEKRSTITVKFITDVTVRDYSVYSTKGIKRDYSANSTTKEGKKYFSGYQLEKNETATQLINAKQKDGYLQVTKTWRFENTSTSTYQDGSITPELVLTQKDTPDNDILIDKATAIAAVAVGATFEVSVPIKIPAIAGTYKQSFRLNDKDGNRIIASGADNYGQTFYLTIRVVPHDVYSPVLGQIDVGDAIKGRQVGSYKPNTMTDMPGMLMVLMMQANLFMPLAQARS